MKNKNEQIKSIDEIMKQNKQRKLPPKQPKTQNDKTNYILKLSLEAPAYCTDYDYGRPH